MPPRHKPDAPERERARQALALRTQGLSYAEIARRLGYRGEAGPRKAIDRMLSRREHEAAGQLRAVEGQRLDDAQAAIWPKVLRGDLGAVRELVRISERRSRLLGLDAPLGIAVEGVSAEEFGRRAAELIVVLAESEEPGTDSAARLLVEGIPEAYRALEPTVRDRVCSTEEPLQEWDLPGFSG